MLRGIAGKANATGCPDEDRLPEAPRTAVLSDSGSGRRGSETEHAVSPMHATIRHSRKTVPHERCHGSCIVACGSNLKRAAHLEMSTGSWLQQKLDSFSRPDRSSLTVRRRIEVEVNCLAQVTQLRGVRADRHHGP